MYLQGLGEVMRLAGLVLLIAVPLALWKLAEVVIWLFSHVTISAS